MTEALTIDIEQLGLPTERRPVALLVSLEPQDPHFFSTRSHDRFVNSLVANFRRTPGQWKGAAGADNPKEYLEQHGMLIPRHPFPPNGISSEVNIMDEWHTLTVGGTKNETFDPDSHAGILLGLSLSEAGLRMAEGQVVQEQVPSLVKKGAVKKLQAAANWCREQAEAILEPRVRKRQLNRLSKKLLAPTVVGLTTVLMATAVDQAFAASDDNEAINTNPAVVQIDTDNTQEAAQTIALKAVRSIFDQLPTSINVHTEQYSSYPAAATVALGVSSEDSAGPIKPENKVLDELELVGVDVHKIGNGNHTVSLGRTTENFVQSLEESINPVFANEANSLLSQIRHHELLERIDPDFNYYTDVLLHDRPATFYVPEDADDEAVFILEAGIELPTAEESTKVKRLREKLGIEQKEDGTQYFQIALYEKDGRMEIGNFTITVNPHGDLIVRNKYEREVNRVQRARQWIQSFPDRLLQRGKDGEKQSSQTKQWSSVELQDGRRPREREGDGLSDLFNRALRPEQEILHLDLPEGDWDDPVFLQEVKALLEQESKYQNMIAQAEALVEYVNSTGEATNAVSRDVIAPLPDGTILLTQWIEDDNGVAFIVIDEQGGMYAAIAPEKNTDILPAVASWDGQYAFVPLAVSKAGPIDLLIINDEGLIEQVRLTIKQREEFGLALTSFSQEHTDLTPVIHEEDEEELILTPDQQFFASYEWNPATDTVSVTPDGETLQVTRDGETFNTPVIKVNITERHAGKELGFYQEHDGWHPTVGIYLSSSIVEETQDRIRLEGYISDNGPFLKITYILPSRDGTDAIILVNTIGANLIYEGADITLGIRGDISNGGPNSKAVSLQEAYNYLQDNYQSGGTMLVQLPVFDERGDIMNVAALRQWWETGDRSVLPQEVQAQGYMVVLGRSTAINRLPQQQPAASASSS